MDIIPEEGQDIDKPNQSHPIDLKIEAIVAIHRNLQTVQSVITDVSESMYVQIIMNGEQLLHRLQQTIKNLDQTARDDLRKEFDLLLREPIKRAARRLTGLNRVVSEIKNSSLSLRDQIKLSGVTQ